MGADDFTFVVCEVKGPIVPEPVWRLDADGHDLARSRFGACFLELPLRREDEASEVQLASVLKGSRLPDQVAELVRLQPFS